MTATPPGRPARGRLAVLLSLLAATAVAAVWPDDGDVGTDDLVAARPASRETRRPSPPSAPPEVVAAARPTGLTARAPLDESAGTTLFGPADPPPPPPAPTVGPPPPAPAAPLPAPPAAVPPTVTPRGLLLDGDRPRALLETADGRVLVLGAGDGFDGDWRLETLQPRALVLLHLPTQARHTLPLPLDPSPASPTP